MKSHGGAFNYSPANVLAGGGDMVAGFAAVSATLSALYKPDGPRNAAAGLEVLSSYEDALRYAIDRTTQDKLSREPSAELSVRDKRWWSRWLAGARDASMAVCDAFWCLPALPGLIVAPPVRLKRARSVANALKWAACDRYAPDDVLWQRIGELVVGDVPAKTQTIAGDFENVGREYLRAVAHHSVGLDQLDFEFAFAVMRVVDSSLPFLSLSKTRSGGIQWAVPALARGMPRRIVSIDEEAEWYLKVDMGIEWLLSIIDQLDRGHVHSRLGFMRYELLRTAVEHVLLSWCQSPPVRRRRRYPLSGGVSVTRGFDDFARVLIDPEHKPRRAWMVANVSRQGMYAVSPNDPSGAWPDIGELIGIRFTDGYGWSLSIVRRLWMWPNRAGLGLEFISRQPRKAQLDGGELSVDVLLCDQPLKGEVVRLVLPADAKVERLEWFLRADSHVFKVRELESHFVGRDYNLRAFQVL